MIKVAEKKGEVAPKKRTASPSAKAGGSGPPLKPPVVVASPGEAGGYPKRIILHMPADLTKWLDEEWHRRRLQSRAETIRAILSEARGK